MTAPLEVMSRQKERPDVETVSAQRLLLVLALWIAAVAVVLLVTNQLTAELLFAHTLIGFLAMRYLFTVELKKLSSWLLDAIILVGFTIFLYLVGLRVWPILN